jgi:hypothetical protein
MSNMAASSKHTQGAAGSSGGREANATAGGIALSGMYIYNALDGNNSDAVESELKTLDVCISHPSPFGALHYHYWGPCIKPDLGYFSNSAAPELCKNEANCLT